MNGQRNDLQEAEEALKQVIKELDTGMKKQFMEQFVLIQREFDKAFKELFGGGKGTLELIDEEDVYKRQLKTTLKKFDTSQYGGAPLLGLKGLVVKTHGSSKAVEIKNSILQCVTFVEQGMNDKIKAGIQAEEMK